jgi:hypothetical protein
MNEDTLNVLLADGYDPATAYAAAQPDQPAPRRSSVSAWAILVGVLIVLWMILK